MLLDERKVFITGGSRGIGEACVRNCVREGAMVGFTYKSNRQSALDISDELGSMCVPYHADTSSSEETRRALRDFSKRGDKEGIDGLIINAGIYRRKSFDVLGLEEWSKTISVNLDGAFITAKSAISHMTGGSIVIISSQIAFKGSTHGADYSASKAGLLGLSRSMALEMAPLIRVNVIAPGFIDTDLLAGDSEEKRNKRISRVPLNRIGSPEEIAAPAVFLLSNMSSYITGAYIDVNGGLYIH